MASYVRLVRSRYTTFKLEAHTIRKALVGLRVIETVLPGQQ